MVLAALPVASARRLAARPVGEHRATSRPLDSNKARISLVMVVFPVPGPPVSTITFFLAARPMASHLARETIAGLLQYRPVDRGNRA